MRAAWLVLLAACAAAPRERPRANRPIALASPVPPLATPVPEPSAMRCVDTRDADGVLLNSACEVTRITQADARDLERRSKVPLYVGVRSQATQADFETLSAVPFLTYVSIMSSKVERLDVLARFERLETLGIDVSAAPTLPALAHLPIRALTIGGAGRMQDLSTLAGFVKLETLHVGGGPALEVGRLDGIEALPALTTFMTLGTILDGTALGKAVQLKHLHIGNGRIPLGAIRDLRLETLALSLQKMRDDELAFFSRMPSLLRLKKLDLSTDRIPELPRMPGLVGIRISVFPPEDQRASADLAFVRRAPRLESFAFGGVKTADLTPLLELRDLEYVDIAGICRVDARPLARLKKLRWVVVSKQLDDMHRPKREGVQVIESNPFALCSG